jgi:hypothetical protein
MMQVITGELGLVTGRVHKDGLLGGCVVGGPSLLCHQLIRIGCHGQPDLEVVAHHLSTFFFISFTSGLTLLGN